MLRTLVSIFFLSTSTLLAEPPVVVTDIAPTHSLVSQVMEGVGTPTLLLTQGADPHRFQMRPSQVRSLSDADVAFWIGSELTPWLDRALKSVGEAKAVSLIATHGTVLRESTHTHEHHDGAHSNTSPYDPHAWLSPANGRHWLGEIARTLAKQDPANAEVYMDNARKARANINELDQDLSELLAPVREHGFILYHNSLGYFADHYALNVLGAIRESDATPPSAARLAEIVGIIETGKVHCAFAEVSEGETLVKGILENRNVGFGVLDPTGAALDAGPTQYEDLLRSQAQAIADCLSSAF